MKKGKEYKDCEHFEGWDCKYCKGECTHPKEKIVHDKIVDKK